MGKLFEFDEHIGDWRVLVQSRDIQNGAIQSRHIAPEAVISDKIDNNAIQSRHITPGAVTGDKIDDNAIQSRHIAPGAVTPDKIAPGAIDDIRILFQDLVDNYKPIVINGDVTNAPDEEDITEVDGLLKLKNRPAGLYSHGYKILRRGIPLLEQMNLINTIYEIRYDFDLGGETLTVPENCVLKFEGGSINNGTIVGDSTSIEAAMFKIFKDITIAGTWSISESYPEWFGAKGDGVADDTAAIQACINNMGGHSVVVLSNVYNVTSTINIPSKTIIAGRSTVIQTQLPNSKIIFNGQGACFAFEGKREICIRDLSITKTNTYKDDDFDTTAIFLGTDDINGGYCNVITISNVAIFGFTYGIANRQFESNMMIDTIIDHVNILWCKYGFYGYLQSSTIRDSYIGTNMYNITARMKNSLIERVIVENGVGLKLSLSEGSRVSNLGWESQNGESWEDEHGNKYTAINISNSFGITIDTSRIGTIPTYNDDQIGVINIVSCRAITIDNVNFVNNFSQYNEPNDPQDSTFIRAYGTGDLYVRNAYYKNIKTPINISRCSGKVSLIWCEHTTDIINNNNESYTRFIIELNESMMKALPLNVKLATTCVAESRMPFAGRYFDVANAPDGNDDYYKGSYVGERRFETNYNYPVFWAFDNRWVHADGFTGTTIKSASVNRPKHINQGGVLINEDEGYRYYDTNLQKWIYARGFDPSNNNEVIWVEEDGAIAGVSRSGTKDQRPTAGTYPVNNVYTGFKYMQVDEVYGTFPIWAVIERNGSGTEQDPYSFGLTWVKADGSDPDSQESVD